MRILPRAQFRLRYRRPCQCLHNSPRNFRRAHSAMMYANRLRNLLSHAHHRIQRRHRLLKYHRNFAPANPRPLILFQRRQIHRAIRISFRNVFRASAESNFADPLTLAPIGKSPINANANIVFPDPDSPTNPNDAPRSNRSDTSFTGRTHPPGVGNSTVNARNSKSALIRT